MAEPTVGSIGANAQGTTANLSLGAPSGVVNGSVVVAFIFLDGAAQTVTPPASWSEAPNSPINVTGGSHGLHVIWHRATGSEAGPYSFTWTTSTHQDSFAIRFVDAVSSGTPFDSPCGAAETNSLVTTSPAVSTTSAGPDRLDLWASTNWSGGAWTPPSGYTEQRESANQIMSAATHSHPSAGSTGSITGTCAGTDRMTAWIGALIGTTAAAAGPAGLYVISQYGSFH